MVDIDKVKAMLEGSIETLHKLGYPFGDANRLEQALAALEQSQGRVKELEGAVKKVRVCLKHLPDACPDNCAACVFDEVLGTKDGGNYLEALSRTDGD